MKYTFTLLAAVFSLSAIASNNVLSVKYDSVVQTKNNLKTCAAVFKTPFFFSANFYMGQNRPTPGHDGEATLLPTGFNFKANQYVPLENEGLRDYAAFMSNTYFTAQIGGKSRKVAQAWLRSADGVTYDAGMIVDGCDIHGSGRYY